MADPRWPYTEPHVGVERWKVDIPGALTLKGISRDDALDLAEAYNGTAYRSTVVLVTDGPDKGAEVLGPWREVRGA